MHSSNSAPTVSTDHLKIDAFQYPRVYVFGSDQEQQSDSDTPMSPQPSNSPSAALRYSHRSVSPVESDKGSESTTTLDQNQTAYSFYTQLDLLHQECQEKETLINKLREQLAEWEELHTQLREKDQLNHQYLEALQVAESTIAYLTACNLDSQAAFGSHGNSDTRPFSVDSDAALYKRCIELQKGLQEKDKLNNHLIELLTMTEKNITSSDCQEKNLEISDLRTKIEAALQQVNTSSNNQSPRGGFGTPEDYMQELQQKAESLQEALSEQNRLNVELQEKLRAVNAAAQHCRSCNNAHQNGKGSRQRVSESLNEESSKEQQLEVGSTDNVSLNQEMTKVLIKCISAAESAVSSLAAHCTNVSSLASGSSSQTSPDLQINLDKLQRALQERKELVEPTQSPTKPSSYQSVTSCGTKGQLHQDLHNNLCQLYKVFSDNYQRISELQASPQEEKHRREESKDYRTVPDAKGLPPSVQVQLETLHKALREKKKACKSLEEKLATALTNTASPENSRKGKRTHAELCLAWRI